MRYFFQLGRQPEISRAEIEQVFFSLDITPLSQKQEDSFFVVETSEELDTTALMERLGGSIKIAKEILQLENKIEDIAAYLDQSKSVGKIQFSLSGKNAESTALEVKKFLKSEGRSVRYIELKNTATILHNNLVEHQTDLTVIGTSLFATVAIQPIEEWGERDFDRPGRDSRSGMLPPKLARIMLNLAGIRTNKHTRLLDPFCGSGTVVTEAYLVGFENIIASDLSAKAIEDTKKNVEWLKQNSPIKNTAAQFQFLISDATRLGQKIDGKSIDIIVTEPFLGKPLRGSENKMMLIKQAEELKSLYTKAFKMFAEILKKNATVVFIIPRFQFQKEWVQIKCAPEIAKLGFDIEPFTEKNSSLLYHRPGQFVAREIWKFKKQ